MIKITQGDYAILNFSLKSGESAAFDLTGATFETKIIGSDDAVDTFNNAHHAIVSASAGTMTLTLSEAETAALKVGTRQVKMKVTQSAHDKFFHGTIQVLKATPEY